MSARQAYDLLTATAARFAAAPYFPDAVLRFSEGYVGLRQGSRLLSKLLSRETSWRVIGHLLYLYADREQFGPDGASYGRLLDLCTRRSGVSRRALRTMLELLHITDFTVVRVSESDRRVKIHEPTERMLEFVRRWLVSVTAAADLLEPQHQRTRSLNGDCRFLERFLVASGRNFTAATPPTMRLPELSFFTNGPENALVVFAGIRLAEMQGVALGSRAKVARRLGLSKTQVTRIITAGTKHDFFSLDENGIAAVTPKARALYDRWVALELAFYVANMPPARTASLQS
jgi:hypothetical protein